MPRFLLLLALLAAPLAGCGSDADHSGDAHAGEPAAAHGSHPGDEHADDDHEVGDHAAGVAPGRTTDDHSDEHADDDHGSSRRSN